MTADHSSYEELAAARRDSRGFYEVRVRRGPAGLPNRPGRPRTPARSGPVPGRAGHSRWHDPGPRSHCLKLGGVVPTIPLLERISAALYADLIVELAPHAA